MRIEKIVIPTFCVLFSLGGTPISSNAATTFGGSRIIAIDHNQRTITFKTKEGETWTLPVTDPNLLNQQPSAKEDQVTIHINFNDEITSVVRSSEVAAAPKTDSEDR
jgi:hypothetical protein